MYGNIPSTCIFQPAVRPGGISPGPNPKLMFGVKPSVSILFGLLSPATGKSGLSVIVPAAANSIVSTSSLSFGLNPTVVSPAPII